MHEIFLPLNSTTFPDLYLSGAYIRKLKDK